LSGDRKNGIARSPKTENQKHAMRKERISRMRGTVKWFNDAKGYGFIQQPDGPDVFVHYSAINGTGRRSLLEGEEVEFEVQQGPKGLQAADVTRLSEQP